MSTPRDTQFTGFAQALFDKMDAHDWLWPAVNEEQDIRLLLARRAYDLAYHVLQVVATPNDAIRPEQIVERIPDMPELPKEPDTSICPDCGTRLDNPSHDIIHDAWQVGRNNALEAKRYREAQ